MNFVNLTVLSIIAVAAACLAGGFLFYRQRKDDDAAMSAFASERLRARYLAYFYPRLRAWQAYLLGGTLVITMVLAFNPSWGQRPNPLVVEDLDILFVVDVSRSMDVNDVAPSRLDRAKSALRLFSQNLAGQRVGIVAFAERAFYYCPLTADYPSFHGFVDSLSPTIIPYQGTELAEVWPQIDEVLSNNKATAKVLVFISDGEFHDSIPSSELKDAAGRSIPAFVLGLGTEAGGVVHQWVRTGINKLGRTPLELKGEKVRSSIDEEKLQNLAEALGGQYHNISKNFQTLLTVSKSLEETRARILKEGVGKQLRSRIYLFAFIPLLLWSGALGVSFVRKET